jgi:hypothetical protein
MTFKPAVWYPIAVVLSGINLAAVWFAAQPAEPLHATTHAALALAFGLWAQRLRQRRGAGDPQTRFDVFEAEVGKLRQELSEAQERLDFAERLLTQRPDPHRVDPQL